MVLHCHWNQGISDVQLQYMIRTLLGGKPVALRIEGITDDVAQRMSNEMGASTPGVPATHRAAWKEWNRTGATPSAAGHPQLTSVMPIPNDPTTNLLWDGICRTLHGFSDATTGTTIVGNAVPSGRSYATPAHYHAPPVINVAVHGKCVKEYTLVEWNDASKGMQESEVRITKAEMRACPYTIWRIGADASLPNTIIFPARTFHLIETVNRAASSEVYLGFGTYFLLKDDAFIDDAIDTMRDAMRYPNWHRQLDNTHIAAVQLATTMQANWASHKREPPAKRVNPPTRPPPSADDTQRIANSVAAAAAARSDAMCETLTDDTIDPVLRTMPDWSMRARDPGRNIDALIRDLRAMHPLYIIPLDVLQRAIDRVMGGGAGSSGTARVSSMGAALGGKKRAHEDAFFPAATDDKASVPDDDKQSASCYVCFADLSGTTFSAACDSCDLVACEQCAGFQNDAHLERYRRRKKPSWKCSRHGRLFHCSNCSDVLVSCEPSKNIALKNSVGCEHETSGVLCETWVCTMKCAHKPWYFVGTWYCDAHRQLHDGE